MPLPVATQFGREGFVIPGSVVVVDHTQENPMQSQLLRRTEEALSAAQKRVEQLEAAVAAGGGGAAPSPKVQELARRAEIAKTLLGLVKVRVGEKTNAKKLAQEPYADLLISSGFADKYDKITPALTDAPIIITDPSTGIKTIKGMRATDKSDAIKASKGTVNAAGFYLKRLSNLIENFLTV